MACLPWLKYVHSLILPIFPSFTSCLVINWSIKGYWLPAPSLPVFVSKEGAVAIETVVRMGAVAKAMEAWFLVVSILLVLLLLVNGVSRIVEVISYLNLKEIYLIYIHTITVESLR